MQTLRRTQHERVDAKALFKSAFTGMCVIVVFSFFGTVSLIPQAAHAQSTTAIIASLQNSDIDSLVSGCFGETKTSPATELLSQSFQKNCNKTLTAGGKNYGVTCVAATEIDSQGTLRKGTCNIVASDKSRLAVSGESSSYQFYDATGKTIGRSQATGGTPLVETSSGVAADKDLAGAETQAAAFKSCSITNLVQCVLNIPGVIFSFLALIVLGISGILLAISGAVFNWVVIRTVFEFGTYFGSSAGTLIAWGVLRDIGNIVLLFGFIFMGIATILNTGAVEGYTAKKALPGLIIFAVLLNFSLFASQAVIDVANGFASVFTAQAGQNCIAGQSPEACSQVGIAGAVMHAAGMDKIFSLSTIGSAFGDEWKNISQQPYSYTIFLLCLSIFVTITAVVLLAGAIMLVIRVVVLSLLMVTSPIGFAGMAIPAFSEMAKSWWKALISQSFFAPVYLLLIFISLKLTEGLMQGKASLADALLQGNGVAGNMQVVLIFLIVIGFMVASLMAATKLGAAGAGYATKTAGGLALGTYGFLGRRTLGAASNSVAQRIRTSEWAQNHPGQARLAYNFANKGATASYSARNLATAAGKNGKVKLDFGQANKTAAHGFHGIEEKAVKDREDFLKKTLKPSEKQRGVATEVEEELIEVKKRRAEHLADQLNLIEEQRVKVQKARLANDKAGLERAREELKRRTTEYDRLNGADVKIGDEIIEGDADGKRLAAQQKELEVRLKAWSNRAEQQKTDTYLEGLHGNVYLPGSVGNHADHEAAANIRKGKGSDLDQALAKIKKAAEKDDEEDAPAAPAHAPAGAPAGGDAHGAAPHT
ncbi:MAG: hypothetical protein JWN64_554 [Parcubacteria group bacterium]|nr:hypothetical protein [Parcubacteria group bacterium]